MTIKSKTGNNNGRNRNYLNTIIALTVFFVIFLVLSNLHQYHLRQTTIIIKPEISPKAFWEQMLVEHPDYKAAYNELTKYIKED